MKIKIILTVFMLTGICMASQVHVLPIEKVADQIKNVYTMKVLESSLKPLERTYKTGVTRITGYEETCRCELEEIIVGKWKSKKKIITVKCVYNVAECYDENGKVIDIESEITSDLGLRILRSNSNTIKKGTTFILCTDKPADADSGKPIYPTRIVLMSDQKKLMDAIAKFRKK